MPYNKEKMSIVTTAIPKEQKAVLERVAKEEKRSLAAQLALIIETWLKERNLIANDMEKEKE